MERRDKEINGRTYALLLPSAMVAMGLCTRTTVLLGPVLGGLGKDVETGGLEVFAKALRGVDPEAANVLMIDAVRAAHLCCAGEPVSDTVAFEKHFSQHRADLYLACLWALWECVRDFFPQLDVFIPQAKEALAKASPSRMVGRPTGGSAAPSGRASAPGPSSKTVRSASKI